MESARSDGRSEETTGFDILGGGTLLTTGGRLRRATPRFIVESFLGLATIAVSVMTLLWRDWIEVLFRVDPDQSGGSVEWFVVGASAVIAAVLFLAARDEWRRTDFGIGRRFWLWS
jgi:hypothetical protein